MTEKRLRPSCEHGCGFRACSDQDRREQPAVIPLANSDDLELGERLILIDDSIAIDIVSKFINDYTSPLDKNESPRIQERIMIMKTLSDSYNGATVINVKGEIVGISEGGDLFIPTMN